MKHPKMTDDEVRAYLMGLQPGERVQETGVSGLYGRQGDVYLNDDGDVCVLWDERPGEGGRMGSSVTWGARRLEDVPCGCFNCLDDPSLGLDNPTGLLFIVCPKCGNKRCPRATNHELDCTGSNEPGQPGSRYPCRRPDMDPTLHHLVKDWQEAIDNKDLEAGRACRSRMQEHYREARRPLEIPGPVIEVAVAFDVLERQGPVVISPDDLIAAMITDLDHEDFAAARRKLAALQGSWASGGPQPSPSSRGALLRAVLRPWGPQR